MMRHRGQASPSRSGSVALFDCGARLVRGQRRDRSDRQAKFVACGGWPQRAGSVRSEFVVATAKNPCDAGVDGAACPLHLVRPPSPSRRDQQTQTVPGHGCVGRWDGAGLELRARRASPRRAPRSALASRSHGSAVARGRFRDGGGRHIRAVVASAPITKPTPHTVEQWSQGGSNP